jgi:alkanesulfonate monooxygenase SsuD/methylene tetrahydromethanopterin reductase-like flavin-dependent oxidoreductase (luciferase family)
VNFGLFWQTPGFEGSSVARRHWETVEEIELGEKLGFESAWLAESVFYPTRPMSNPLMVAIAAGQRTERIRFGTLAYQTPLHHPYDIATQSATCDILTSGRLNLGLGGRWGAPAGRWFGNSTSIPGPESRERVEEAIKLVRLAWTNDRIDFEGKYWRADNLPVLPRPVQQPHPPLYLAANSNDTFAYVARMGLSVIGTTLSQPMPRIAQRIAEFEEAKPSSGTTQQQTANVMVSFFVANTRKEAEEYTNRNWLDTDQAAGIEYMRSMGIDPSKPDFTTGATGWMTWDYARAKEVCIYDSPEGCVDRLLELKEAIPTLDTCILEMNRRARIPSEKVRESMKLFADKVRPKLS